MKPADELREAIVAVLREVKAYSLPAICDSLGLEATTREAMSSKRLYVESRLDAKDPASLVTIGETVLQRYESDKAGAHRLREALRLARSGGKRQITEVTRRKIQEHVSSLGNLQGKLSIDDFLRRVWPIESWPSSDNPFRTFLDDLEQHMARNDDWTVEHVLSLLPLDAASDELLCEFLELLVHPLTRDGDGQRSLVSAINAHLHRDGLELRESERLSGYPVFRVLPLDRGVDGTPKNLIFASNGPKPEIVLTDAVNNTIKVVRNGEHCLHFDRPFPDAGLLWSDLVAWWAESDGRDATAIETERALYARLYSSLESSPPQRLLFGAFFKSFKHLGPRLPALVPEVYLHFDPKTVTELYGAKRLPRQRMDFLLLFAASKRVIIEVDGQQHFAVGNVAAPSRYAEMVAADRQLRLLGYEVYRFGGAELQGEEGKALVERFFRDLFKKHGVPLK